MAQPLWRTVWWFFNKIKHTLLYDPPIVLLGIYPKELRIYVHTKTYTQMPIATIYMIIETWKKPKCSSAGEWINILCHWSDKAE